MKLAEEGRRYILATLERFGVVRHALLSAKQPLAARYSLVTPPEAEEEFAAHISKCAAARSMAGYLAYAAPSPSNPHRTQPEGAGEASGGGGGGGGGGTGARLGARSRRGGAASPWRPFSKVLPTRSTSS